MILGFDLMVDQTNPQNLLNHTLQAMSEHMLQIQSEVSSLRTEMQELAQMQLYLLAKADLVDAMQVNLNALEEQLAAVRQPRQNRQRPASGAVTQKARRAKHSRQARMMRRFALIVFSAMSVISGIVLAVRSLPIQSHPAFLNPLRRDRAVNQSEASRSTLALTTVGPTWLEVQTTDRRNLFYGLAKPGQYRFLVHQPVRIRAGRPDLVHVKFQELNSPLGTVEATGWRVFQATSR